MLTPAMRKEVLKIMRYGGWETSRDARRRLRYVDYAINERASFAAAIARNQRNGIVAVCRSGMDCDCTQYARTRHERVADLHLFAFWHAEQHHREWLDGPESMWFAPPDEEEERYASADRALEAYEDGHPHVVHWGDV